MPDNKTLLARLKNVGDISILLKMSYDIQKFLRRHQVNFPQTGDFDRVYVQVIDSMSDEAFEVYNGKVSPLELMAEKGSLIRVSKADLLALIKALDLTQIGDSTENHLAGLLTAFRKVAYIKQYQTVLKLFEPSFETNLKLKSFVKVILNQL